MLGTRFVRIALVAQLTGYTEKAIRRKIEEGVWLEGAIGLEPTNAGRKGSTGARLTSSI